MAEIVVKFNRCSHIPRAEDSPLLKVIKNVRVFVANTVICNMLLGYL